MNVSFKEKTVYDGIKIELSEEEAYYLYCILKHWVDIPDCAAKAAHDFLTQFRQLIPVKRF